MFLTARMEKPQYLWEVGQSTQRGLASVLEKITPKLRSAPDLPNKSYKQDLKGTNNFQIISTVFQNKTKECLQDDKISNIQQDKITMSGIKKKKLGMQRNKNMTHNEEKNQ